MKVAQSHCWSGFPSPNRRLNPSSQPRTPAIKSSIGVLSSPLHIEAVGLTSVRLQNAARRNTCRQVISLLVDKFRLRTNRGMTHRARPMDHRNLLVDRHAERPSTVGNVHAGMENRRIHVFTALSSRHGFPSSKHWSLRRNSSTLPGCCLGASSKDFLAQWTA
jgi:hypothetical protein